MYLHVSHLPVSGHDRLTSIQLGSRSSSSMLDGESISRGGDGGEEESSRKLHGPLDFGLL